MSRYSFYYAPVHFGTSRHESFLRETFQPRLRERIRLERSWDPVLLPEPSELRSYRQIMAPLDGSPYAEHALPWAIQIAALANARLSLACVHPQMQPSFHGRRRELHGDFDRLLRQPMEEYLADVTRRVARTCPQVTVNPLLIDGRDVAEALPEVASGFDLVVMATRGRTAAGRLLLGSTPHALLGGASSPLLHVRGYSCPVDLTARPSLSHALVALDGTAASTRILEPVAALSKLTDGRQTFLRVMSAAGLFSQTNHSEDGSLVTLDSAEGPVAQMEEVASSWTAKLPQVRSSVVWSQAAPAREILLQANEREADFIAVATRTRSKLRRLFKPGVFEHLIRHSRIPVLVVQRPD